MLIPHIPIPYPEICKIWVESAIVLLTSSLSFQPNQEAMDNFDAVDLSWVRCTTDPLKVLRHGIILLQDPSKIDESNCKIWCNLYITPTPKGIIVEVCSLEEVAHWARIWHLGSAPDPTQPRVTNLIVALGNNPWPCTLGLARVQVVLNQKLCSLIEAMDSAREHFNREKGLEAAHYYLTPVYTEAPYLLSDVGLQAEDGTAMAIGVTTLGVNPRDNAVHITASEEATSTLVLHHLLHLSANLVLIPPQLSHAAWTGMRRTKIGYESFIHFPASYIPPNVPESECNSQQLTLMGGLYVPEPGVLLDLAEQLDSLRTASPRLKASDSKAGDKHGAKEETPKKIKSGDTRDTPKKHHKSHEEKSQSKQSPTEKSPAPLTHKHDVDLEANRLGDVVPQACLFVARMTQVVESTHNSKIAEALLTRQHLEKASAEVIDSVMDEIQGAHTPADMW